MEQHVPSVLTSQQQNQQQQQQQQHHQQQQQLQNQQQQFTSQSRRPGPEQNLGRSVGSNGQISNSGPASVNQGHLSGPVNVNQAHLGGHASGNHGHGNGQVNVLANHSQGGGGHIGTSSNPQGYSNVSQGHANVLSSLLALSDPQVDSIEVSVGILR